MAGPHVEPDKERSVDARIARLRARIKLAQGEASDAGQPTAPYTLLLAVVDLLDAEL